MSKGARAQGSGSAASTAAAMVVGAGDGTMRGAPPRDGASEQKRKSCARALWHMCLGTRML